MSELNNISVLVIRPGDAGEILCDELESQGAHAYHLPTIEFKLDTVQFTHAKTILPTQDLIIFISPHAVDAAKELFNSYILKKTVAAVGAGTAAKLMDAGFKYIISPQIDWSSEGLLKLNELHEVQNKKIAIIGGHGGRDLLGQSLKVRGADVTFLAIYERVLPKFPMESWVELLRDKKIDIVVAASFTSVKHFKEMFGALDWSLLAQIPLIVVSERIKMLASNLGFQTIWVAQNAAHSAIIKCLMKKKDAICQIKQKQQQN